MSTHKYKVLFFANRMNNEDENENRDFISTDNTNSSRLITKSIAITIKLLKHVNTLYLV